MTKTESGDVLCETWAFIIDSVMAVCATWVPLADRKNTHRTVIVVVIFRWIVSTP
jgi:hypothetical protein